MLERQNTDAGSRDCSDQQPDGAHADSFRINLLDAVTASGVQNHNVELRTVSGDSPAATTTGAKKTDDDAAKKPAAAPDADRAEHPAARHIWSEQLKAPHPGMFEHKQFPEWTPGLKLSGEGFLKDIQAWKELAQTDEHVLRKKLHNLQTGCDAVPTQPLDWQKASVAAALGEICLQKGTATHLAKPYDRINFAENLDLGGQAALYLRFSQRVLAQHEKSAAPEQVHELRVARGHIEGKLAAVNGDHNITGPNGAFYQLRDMFSTRRDTELLHFGLDLTNAARRAKTNEPEFASKACRDAALFEIAYADHKILKDPIGATVLIKEANKLLRVSQELDPMHGSDDIRQMREVLEQLRLGKKFVSSDPQVDSQWKQNSFDPKIAGKVAFASELSGISGLAVSSFLRESATQAQLQQLAETQFRAAGILPRHMRSEIETFKGTTAAEVRPYLAARSAAGQLTELESKMLRDIKVSGLTKGFLTGLAVVGANYALDQTLLKGGRYGTASLIGDTSMPLVAMLPTNAYVKGALMLGAHAAGRLIDKYW